MSKDNPSVSWEELAVSTMIEVQAIIKGKDWLAKMRF